MLPSPVARSLWLEPAAHLGSLGFLPIAFGEGGRERGGGKAVCGKDEREEQKDTHSDGDERTRAALPGFTLDL
jgi:hypothetical protein